MTSFSRKIKRKNKSEFSKKIKKTFKTFEKVLRCVSCDRVPDVISGEKVDNWHIDASQEGIKLTCPECKEAENDK